MELETKTLDNDNNGEINSEAKTRSCLVCRESFPSEWAGERICRKCKSTAAWRSGVSS